MAHVLGIDVSTTATKAVLVDEGGRVRGIGTAEYPADAPRPLWSEQDSEAWWQGAITAIGSVLASTGAAASDIVGIGLTGQMHGLVLLDADDAVLRPAILWNDQRTAAECDGIRAAVGRERLIALTGNDAVTGLTAPKLAWVRNHEPAIWERVQHVLLPKDFVRLRLTGDHALDKADGSGTQLFDLATRDWSPTMLDALGIDLGGCRRLTRVRRSPAPSPRRRRPRRASPPGRRSWPAAATRQPTAWASGWSIRVRSRCPSARPA